MKKQFMRRTACVLVLALTLANGIVTCAQTGKGSFRREGSTASAMVTGSGKIGAASTAIESGDYTKICFAQVVPIKSNGTYTSGGAATNQLAYAYATCKASNNKHSKFLGVHQLKNSSYRPYGNAYTHSVKK